MKEHVKDLMTKSVIKCETTTTIKEAISLLKDHNIGFLPITNKNVFVGVVTDRDILIRGVGVYKLNTKIEKIMTNGDLYFVHPSTTLLDAAKKMADHKVRRLVVLDDGNICGVITTKSLLTKPELLPYIASTYLNSETLKDYSIYTNSNPHDSVKPADYPL